MRRFLARVARDSRGFTLAEAVLAAGLAALVLFAALDISWRVWGLVGAGRARFDEESELRGATYWVTRDLRRAEEVNDAAPGGLDLTVNGGTVSYVLRDGSLVRCESGSERIVARGLAAAAFSADEREGGKLVVVELAGSKGGKVRTCVWVYAGS